MPAKNVRKEYMKNGYYHLYNRGVEKRKIFLDEQDYSVFLNYLKIYLTQKDEKRLLEIVSNSKIPWIEKDRALKLLRLNNFFEEIILLAYCLMPNHFHIIVKQKDSNSIDKFMNSLCTRYTMYFNKKYDRVGPLYQGTYKAVKINSDDQFLHLSPYIHKQAIFPQGHALRNQPSSYKDYLGLRRTDWVHPEEILTYFSTSNSHLSYRAFVKQDEETRLIEKITLEEAE